MKFTNASNFPLDTTVKKLLVSTNIRSVEYSKLYIFNRLRWRNRVFTVPINLYYILRSSQTQLSRDVFDLLLQQLLF